MNAHSLKTTFHTSVRGRALLALLAVSALLLTALTLWPSWARAQDDGPPPPSNLRCLAETNVVMFVWDAPSWSAGEVASYDYELRLPSGRTEGGRVLGGASLRRSGSFQLGGEAVLSVSANYETPGGSDVSSGEATLACYVGGEPPKATATPTTTPTPTATPAPMPTPTPTPTATYTPTPTATPTNTPAPQLQQADTPSQRPRDCSDSNIKNDADLRGCNFADRDLSGANLRGADLTGANLTGADLRDADLRGTKLNNATLANANLSNNQLTQTQLRGVDLRQTNLRQAQFYETDLTDANLSGLTFKGNGTRDTKCYFNAANLERANLSETTFNLCNLHYSSFRSANLTNAVVICGDYDDYYNEGGTALRNTDFERADVAGATFTGCDMSGVKNWDGARNTGKATIINSDPAPTATPTATPTPTVNRDAHTATVAHSPDRAALIAIYNATNGPNWGRIRDWLSDKPIGDWERVHTDRNNRVTELHLNGYGLSGPMPWEHLTKLTELRALRIQDNQLSGSISPDVGKLSKLQQLFLHNNYLSGSIPPELGNLSNLGYLDLKNNRLSGSIPPELGDLSNLRSLNLYGNRLSGSIPPGLGRLSKLQGLHLHENRLSGSIPWEHLTELTELKYLNLNDNQLNGMLPPELGRLTKLESLHLIDSQISGSIPTELGRLTKLEGLYLSDNQLSGSIPTELGSLSKLESLHLSENRLSGSIPTELGDLTELESLRLHDNQLSGSIPLELGKLTKLEELSLGDNQLNGSIPPELGNLTRLEELRLSGNRLSGTIPSELGNTNLRLLSLSGNSLSGCFPREFQRLHRFNPRYFYPLIDGIGLPWCVETAEPQPQEQEQPAEEQPQQQEGNKYADLIAQMYGWRNGPEAQQYGKPHTDRWDRALLAFGETVADATITPMTAAEAQALADQDWGTRWVPVAAALRDLESAAPQPVQQQQPQQQPPQQQRVNRAPTVAAAISDTTIVSESGTRTVSLSGVFADADNDALTVNAASSNEAVATVSVASDYSGLTVAARSRGAATITVTASDGNGGTVSDSFTVTVKAAPTVASAIADLSLELGGNHDILLSGVFSDADGDALTFTATSSDPDVANALELHGALTIIGALAGSATVTVTAQDSDGNSVSDEFDVTVAAPQQPTPTPTPTPEPTPTPTPEPTPTPTPTPEPETPEPSTLSGAAARYDANGNGRIDASEYRQALSDYNAGKITYAEMLEVILATFRGG